jgi:exopolysaccharide biosynthesis predicted pyruvyltransferase EpsI
LIGKRIGYIRPFGNVGDALIEWATTQLFAHFDIQWKQVSHEAPPADVDELVFGGGGNMGTLWEGNWKLRAKCLSWGLPLTIFPQSFTSPEERPFQRVYVRERASLELYPRGILAPDLALGLDCGPYPPPRRRLGVHLRKDTERGIPRNWFPRDPVKLCRTPHEYLQLAARYESIVTDRLHFAICGLLLGRQVVLLPNSYHKNRSMYETWLRDLGCMFAPEPRAATELLEAARYRTRPVTPVLHIDTTVRFAHEPVLHACRSAFQ